MIGTITIGHQGGQKPSAPLPVLPLAFAGDGAYPAGGTAGFQAALRTKLGGSAVEILAVVDGGCGLYVPLYDKAADKLMAFVRTTGVEVAPAVDLSGTTFNVVAICR